MVQWTCYKVYSGENKCVFHILAIKHTTEPLLTFTTVRPLPPALHSHTMSTTNTLPTGSSTFYLAEGLQGLKTDQNADAELREQATKCLSYLFPYDDRKSKRVRKVHKQELAGSSINAEGLAATDSVHDRDTKLKLLKIAARIVSKSTNEKAKKTMMDEYGFDCNNAYRLGGPNGTLNNSAFAAAIPGQKDK